MATPRPPRRRLTRKQAKLARARVKDPEATLEELGKQAGYRDRTHAHRELKKEHVQQRIQDLMDAHPATTDAGLLKTLREGLQAQKTEFFQHEVITGYVPVKDGRKIVRDSKGKPKLRPVKELKIIAKDCVDHGTRHRYLDTAVELKGHKRKKLDVTSNGNTIKSLLLEDE